MNIYREVVAYINSHQPGTSFTTKDFHKHMASLGYRDTYQPHYRVNTYRTYLRSAGFVSQIGRGVWMTVYVIPEWVTLKMLETARGYGRGCNKVVQRETQDKIAAYFAEQKKTEKTWKIGDRFTVTGITTYTIEVSHLKNCVKVTWVDRNGHNQSLSYPIATVDEYFSKGSWKLIEKTNIQENVSPVQKDSVDLHHTKTQITMAKQTALPVSPAFIIEAHSVACGTWKTKLEQMYPSVFLPAQTFKAGDRVQFPQSTQFTNATYLLANTGNRRMTLINMQTGGRWTELVEVKSESAITAEEMAKICYGQKLETILVNGTSPTLNTKPSTDKTLMAQVSDIKAAYQATSDKGTLRMIKDYFPEAFSKYVKFASSSNDSITLSPYTETIDGVDFIIGRGMAPRPELEGACIGVLTDKVEVEIIKEGERTWVAFKKI